MSSLATFRSTGFARMILATSLVFLVVGALGLLFWFLFLKPVVIRVADRLPESFPAAGFDHGEFEGLLERFVTPAGRVRYDDWSADAAALERLDGFLAALARYSPDNAPERFPNEADRLSYWLNAYNACALKGVLAHWPIGSVHDVRAPLELKAGLGFFWRLHFVLGGRVINLYQLEHEVIRARFQDPRIHFVLNCASGGCPALAPELPTGSELEQHLRQATRDFIGDSANVAVDHEARTLVLSAIFKWYEGDFLADLARHETGLSQRTLRSWLVQVAEGELQADLERAAEYRVVFADYDWQLNGEQD